MALSEEFTLAGQQPSDDEDSSRPTPGIGGLPRRVVRLGALLAIVAIVFMAAAATIRSQWFSGSKAAARYLTTTVHPADLVITVTEEGTVESASNIDIKSKVAGQTTILSIVKDGTEVKEGDELARLDSSTIEDSINQQTIVYEKAKATKIEAENNFEAAKLGVREYEEGTYLQSLEVAKENVTIAMENLRSAENTLQHTERMARKGYVTSLQRDAQAFAVERAKLDLSVAQKAQSVLEEFTKAKTLSELQTLRDTNEAKMRSEEASFKLEEARLRRLEDQLKECVIKAPRDGLMVYANEISWRGGQPQVVIEEGATVRERQTIFRLPDLSEMQAKVSIHETKIEDIEAGMRARIRIQQREFQGTVTTVANQADPPTWPPTNAKKYTTYVRIDGTPDDLRPGMTAKVEILIGERMNVLSVPTQAVVENEGSFYCWVLQGSQPTRHEVLLGKKNLTDVEITHGLADGDVVLLDPRPFETEEDSGGKKNGGEIDVKKKFGEQAVAESKSKGPRPSRPEGGKGGEGRAKGSARAEGGIGLPTFGSLDKDGDKKVTRDELPEQMKAFFDRMDANSDGFVDSQEYAKAVEAVKRMSQGQGAAQGGPPN